MRIRRRRVGGEPGSSARDPARGGDDGAGGGRGPQKCGTRTGLQSCWTETSATGESLSAQMLALEGMTLRREPSAAARRQPSSRSRGSKSDQSLQHSSWQAEKLATWGLAAHLPPSPPAVMPRDARRQSSSERGRPIRWHMAERTSQSAVRRPVSWASGGTVRQEYRTLDHPEHGRNRQKALWASGNLPTADRRALTLPMRRPKSSSRHSLDPIGAPKSLKLEARAPLEVAGGE